MKYLTCIFLVGSIVAASPSSAGTAFEFRASPQVIGTVPSTGTGTGTGTGNSGSSQPGISAATIADTPDTFVPNPTAPEDFGPGKEFDIVGNTVRTKSKRILLMPYGSARDRQYQTSTFRGGPLKVDKDTDTTFGITKTENNNFFPLLVTFNNPEVVGSRLTLLPTSNAPDLDGLFTYDLSYVLYPAYTASYEEHIDPACPVGVVPFWTDDFSRVITFKMTIGITTSDTKAEKMFVIPTQVMTLISSTRSCATD